MPSSRRSRPPQATIRASIRQSRFRPTTNTRNWAQSASRNKHHRWTLRHHRCWSSQRVLRRRKFRSLVIETVLYRNVLSWATSSLQGMYAAHHHVTACSNLIIKSDFKTNKRSSTKEPLVNRFFHVEIHPRLLSMIPWVRVPSALEQLAIYAVPTKKLSSKNDPARSCLKTPSKCQTKTCWLKLEGTLIALSQTLCWTRVQGPKCAFNQGGKILTISSSSLWPWNDWTSHRATNCLKSNIWTLQSLTMKSEGLSINSRKRSVK